MPNPSIESRNYIRYFFMNIKKPVGQPAGSAGHAVGHFVSYLTLIHIIAMSEIR